MINYKELGKQCLLGEEQLQAVINEATGNGEHIPKPEVIRIKVNQAQHDRTLKIAETLIRKECDKEWVKWGDEVCMEHGMKKRRRCDKCWQARKEEG